MTHSSPHPDPLISPANPTTPTNPSNFIERCNIIDMLVGRQVTRGLLYTARNLFSGAKAAALKKGQISQVRPI